MSTPDRYRQLASECLRIAQQISDPADKMLLLEMAEMWRQLAERAQPRGTRLRPGSDEL
jgi:hypothetical protein